MNNKPFGYDKPFDCTQGKPVFVRQVKFKDDATLSDVPSNVTERPQLDAQGNLLLWVKEKELLKRLTE